MLRTADRPAPSHPRRPVRTRPHGTLHCDNPRPPCIYKIPVGADAEGLCISIPAPSDAGEIWGGRNDLPFKRQEHKLELEEQTSVELMMFHEAQTGGEAGPRDIR